MLNPHTGQPYRYRSLVAAGGPAAIANTTDAEKLAEDDTTALLDTLTAAGDGFPAMAAAAAQLDHQRLAGVAVHLMLAHLTASAALAATSHQREELQVQINSEETAYRRKLDRAADYVLDRLDQKTQTA